MITRINPNSRAFTALLGLLAAVPTVGIDIILPSLPAAGDALGVPPSRTGLAMGIYLVSLGACLLVYGPVSDRFGRKPVIIGGSILLIGASIGCMLARSFDQLLLFRFLQGAGASGPGMAAVTIVRDLFEGEAARAKMSFVVFAVNVMPMVAPSIGAVLLDLGGWRAIYAVPVLVALLLLAMIPGLAETARIDPGTRLRPASIVQQYLRVLTHPVCVGYALCNAAAAGAVFAYITGSSLFFIDAVGLSPKQYGLVFGASSMSVMAGTLLNNRLAARGVSPGQAIAAGLGLSTLLAVLLLLKGTALGAAAVLTAVTMVGVALSFGLISPNAVTGAMQPIPDIAGSASAVIMFVQMAAAATSSALVARFFDGHTPLSMAKVMLAFCVVADACFLALVRPVEPGLTGLPRIFVARTALKDKKGQ